MLKKLNWRIVALIAFVIAAGGFMYWQWSEMQQMKEQAAQFEKMFEEEKKPIAENGLPPAAPGNKWVPHGDHFHEVPIDAPDVWQGEPHEPVAQPAPKKHTGPLTYHEELLKINPVKALRLQAEERGHWSAKWIPPFPADDTEAQAFARNEYLIHYYESIKDVGNPIYIKAMREERAQRRTIMEYPFGARQCDLMLISWLSLDLGDVPPYYIGGARRLPSDYFPDFISDLK